MPLTQYPLTQVPLTQFLLLRISLAQFLSLSSACWGAELLGTKICTVQLFPSFLSFHAFVVWLSWSDFSEQFLGAISRSDFSERFLGAIFLIDCWEQLFGAIFQSEFFGAIVWSHLLFWAIYFSEQYFYLPTIASLIFGAIFRSDILEWFFERFFGAIFRSNFLIFQVLRALGLKCLWSSFFHKWIFGMQEKKYGNKSSS